MVSQLRAVSLLRNWIDRHSFDFLSNPAVVASAVAYLTRPKESPRWLYICQIMHMILQRRLQGGQHVLQQLRPELPKPLLDPNTLVTDDILSLHPLEVARQFALLYSVPWLQIKSTELHFYGKSQQNLSPNLEACLSFGSMLEKWAIIRMATSPDLASRIYTMESLIRIMESLVAIKAFALAFSFVKGLGHSQIRRLGRVWAGISPEHMKAWNEIDALFSKEALFQKLRGAQHAATPPLLPCIELYLLDKQFIFETSNDNQPSTPGQAPLLDWRKYRQYGEVVSDLRTYQSVSMADEFLPVLWLQDRLSRLVSEDDDKQLVQRLFGLEDNVQ